MACRIIAEALVATALSRTWRLLRGIPQQDSIGLVVAAFDGELRAVRGELETAMRSEVKWVIC